MTDIRYPQSLRQVLAYLESHPLVWLNSHYAGTITRANWRYIGHDGGSFRFVHCHGDGGRPVVVLGLWNAELEAGLEFHSHGFEYRRGEMKVFVQYEKGLT